jgi:predicted dinucleotide-utilizing enzyme
MRIAIVGLGRVGGEFLAEMLGRRDRGVVVDCVAEPAETRGKAAARAAGVPVTDVAGVVARGEEIDAVFDLTGSDAVRRELRDGLSASGNRHTAVVPETVVRLIWALIADRPLPQVHDRTGY